MENLVRRALVTLRLLEADPLPPVGLPGRAVEALEVELRGVLPDDVLAAFAANTDELGEQAEMDLSEVLDHTRDVHSRGCAKDLIAVGRHPDGLAFYCIERRTNWEDHPVVLRIFDALDRSTSLQAFGEWLMERVDGCREALQEGDDEDRRRADLEPTQVQIDRFQPRILPALDPAEAAGSQVKATVRHKKFGTGNVLSEQGVGMDRKLEVEFTEVGVKVILARFLDEG